jgi:hypothetical protein
MDELSRYRARKRGGQIRSPLVPPAEAKGDIEVIHEDLVTIHGMVTEVRAEAALCDDVGIEAVRVDLNRLDDAVARAIGTVAHTLPRGG